MGEYCVRCGCRLNFNKENGNWWCPNCSVLKENQDLDEKSKLKKEEMEYVG